ncbi:putative bifunctional diguanylate cyclase/phosphodiesterase [Deefgea rivuli]|uniref:putative bifunctional diguanylate cyclase/phosphodiesterase n=1 Tax=Deefgea rivuli TaxID=400948 RepID=UPI000685F88C|nr:GGDEF and EAL domain-containing protein [Deefgea rivuli]
MLTLLAVLCAVLFAILMIALYRMQQARRALQRHQSLLDSIPDLAWVKDRKSRFVIVNQAFRDIWNIKDPQWLIGKDDFALSPPELAASYQTDDQRVMNEATSLQSERNFEHFRDGSRWMELIKVPVYEHNKIIGTAGIARDISMRKAAEERLSWLAHHDPLTKLGNRSYLAIKIKERITTATPFCVWLIDLDHFKRINDALGHRAGDQALAQVADSLSKIGSEVFRLGGDEFVLLDDLRHAETINEALSQQLKIPVTIEGLYFEQGFTAGQVDFPHDGETPEQLLKHADVALYEGKELGRGHIRRFESHMATQAVRQLELERDLRRALQEGQFRLVYQPQVALDGAQLMGFEALIRWRHPERGEIAPNDFIPFAEQTGIICRIGEWALDCAILQIRDWDEQGLALVPVSVNVSALQLAQPLFAKTVIARLDALPAHLRQYIALELTESTLMHEQALDSVHQLTSAQIPIFMDDFGTGYSNLSTISQLTLSKLKFDRSLIQNVGNDSAHQRVCRALLDLADALELDVIAEGVETAEEAQWLAEQGVLYAQGYWFSRPQESQIATRFLATQK